MSHQPSRTLLRFALRLSGAALVAFHAQLLWERWADGSLTDIAVLAQWSAAALLVVGLVVVYRRRGGLFSSREALVLWVLVVLLHALTGGAGSPALAAPPTLLVVPFGVLLAALWVQLARRTATGGLALDRLSHRRHSPTPLPGHAGVTGSRPPPR